MYLRDTTLEGPRSAARDGCLDCLFQPLLIELIAPLLPVQVIFRPLVRHFQPKVADNTGGSRSLGRVGLLPGHSVDAHDGAGGGSLLPPGDWHQLAGF